MRKELSISKETYRSDTYSCMYGFYNYLVLLINSWLTYYCRSFFCFFLQEIDFIRLYLQFNSRLKLILDLSDNINMKNTYVQKTYGDFVQIN